MKDKQIESKKGFSLVEVMISMGVIVLICAVSIGLVGAFNSASDRMINMSDSTALIENARQLFMYADNLDEFDDLLSSISDLDFSHNGGNEKIYVFNEAEYSGYFIISYNDSSVKYDEFSAVVNSKAGKVIAEISSYKKYHLKK